MPFIENVARGSAKERTVCTLQGVTQKGKCKEKHFEALPEAKNGLLTKHIRFLKAVMKKRTSGKNILILHDLVFVNWRTGEPAKNSSYDTHLYKLCDEAGIKRFCMHALRHTYATRAIERGVQPKVLQQLLGHASIKTTMDRYVHVTDESLVNAIRQFQQATPPVTKKGRKKGVQEI